MQLVIVPTTLVRPATKYRFSNTCNSWPRGVTVSTLDPESNDRGSNPREASLRIRFAQSQTAEKLSQLLVPLRLAD